MKEMVQPEVKKKTRIYVTAAVLAAIVLVSLIFAFSLTPGLTPLVNPPAASAMKTFADETELRNYITANAQGPMTTYRGGPLDSQFFGEKGPALPAESQSDSYSTTNIQVAGVDEADIEKRRQIPLRCVQRLLKQSKPCLHSES